MPGIGAQMRLRRPPRRKPQRGAPHEHHTLAGTAVEVDAEGFLQNPRSGTSEMAAEIAAQNGIADADRPPLAGRSTTCARPTSTTGAAPSIRTLGKASGVPIKELYQLFPKGPAKLAAKIARHPQAARLHLGKRGRRCATSNRHPRAARRRPPADDREGRDHRSRRARWRAIYPGLIMANGARMEGIEANVFFTFFGLDAIRKDRHDAHQGRDRRQPGHAHRRRCSARCPACRRSRRA